MTTSERNPSVSISRRSFGMRAATAGAIATAAIAGAVTPAAPAQANDKGDAKKGRIKQSVCKWCYGNLSLEQMCEEAVKLGLVGIDLLGPNDFKLLKQHGLVCTMVNSHKLSDGLCDPKYQDESLKLINDAIEATAAEGWRNVICFSGNARGIDRRVGMKNCVDALKKITGVAEKKNVILSMELLNSRVDHADYMCDNTTWGIELVKQVGSSHFKLLYDIYHMQIMEGDIIRSIQKNHEFFGHYHTGGNPGRHELNETQELYYPAIARAIADTKFDGFYAHEFIPAGDPITGLTDAVKLSIV